MFEITQGKLKKAQKVVIYGSEGIGKSSFAANFPNPVFIDTEGSTNNMEVARLPKPTSWTMLMQQIQFVKQNPTMMQTMVIDTIDWAEMMCVDHVCSTHGKNGIEDFGYGNGYVYVKEEFGRFLNQLSDVIEVGVNVVLTAHSQIIKFEQPDEMGAYDRYQLKLGKKTSSQTAPLVKEWADMLLFMNYKTFSVATDEKGKKNKAQGGVRTIYANHHPAWDAKNRHGLPDEFPMDYGYIAHIFNAPVAQPHAPQPTAQPQQPPMQPTVAAPPVAEPIPEPAPAPIPEPPVATMPDPFPTEVPATLDPAIPQSLRDLMLPENVTELEIQSVVSKKGYYPIDTPITNYDPGFVQGVLVGAWVQVFGMVQDLRNSLPF
jgi:hypothetical protein